MQYKLIGNNEYILNPIKTILNNRNIEDIDQFLNVNIEHTYHYSLLDNINEAVNCLLFHLNQKHVIYIQIDTDTDGYTSAALLYNYIKQIFHDSNIVYGIHKGKEHGIILDTIPDNVSLVIIPDAGSNQLKEISELNKKNIDCIILDHHEVDGNNSIPSRCFLVNNQCCGYPNKSLSGVGICYKFCQAIDDRLKCNVADNYLDLVALGNIADVMDLRSLETRYYVLKGLKQIRNSFIKALFEKQEYSTKGNINIINSAFYIAPLINACVRFGTQEEKENMFKAFIESDITLPYKKRGATVEVQEPIATAMARICSNIKTKQNNARDKSLEVINKRIEEKDLLKNKILIVDVTNILDTTLTGLVASQLASQNKKPVILLRYNEEKEFYGGSARGYDKGAIKDFKQLLFDTKLFKYTSGHSNAFGIGINSDSIIQVNDVLNEQLKDIVFEDVFDVDFIIPANELNKKLVLGIDIYKDIWSHGVDEPLVAITGLGIVATDVNLLGEKKNTIKFSYRDIEFIKFGCSEDEIEKLNINTTIELDIVGKCKSNEWNGNVTAQIVMSDFITRQSKKFIF